jgi:hypothetical protein
LAEPPPAKSLEGKNLSTTLQKHALYSVFGIASEALDFKCPWPSEKKRAGGSARALLLADG